MKIKNDTVVTENRREKRARDRYSKKYCASFEKLVENDKSLNSFKCLVALMRSGKTHLAIQHHIPFVLKNTDAKLAILTAPLCGIVEQNVMQLREVCTKNGILYCDSPTAVEYALENDMKAAVYMTNSAAWTSEKSISMFDNLIYNEVMTATFTDECWTWTMSDNKVISIISDNADSIKYQASWYKIMEKLASYSPYTYGMSATKTVQLEGEVSPTYGSMNYKIAIEMLCPQELSHRLAWMGDVVYMNTSSLDPDVVSPEKAFEKIVERMIEIEGLVEGDSKRTALIQCSTKENWVNLKGEQRYPINRLKQWVENCDYECGGDDFIGSVNTSYDVKRKDSGIYLFNKNGEIKKVTEEEIYQRLDDDSDPLRFCLTIQKSKMGVTVRTWKEIMLLSSVEKRNYKGYIVYSINQSMGRGLTPNCGESSKVFWKKNGADLSKCEDFPIEFNKINLYLWETGTNKAAVETFKRDFCPTYEDYVSSLNENCPECGAEPQHQKNHLIDEEKLDEEYPQISEKIDEHLGLLN